MRVAVMVFACLFCARLEGGAQGQADGPGLATEYAAAFNAKDAAKVAALYAEDGVWMPPDRPLARGRAAIESALKSLFAGPIGRLDIKVLESHQQGTSATFVGTFNLRTGNPGGMALMGVGGGTVTPGKYVVGYKRVGGDWLIAFNIANFDAPQPAAAPGGK